MTYIFFDQKTASGAVQKDIMQNEELAKELCKQIIRKFEKRKVHSFFIDNIWGADLADIQLISKFDKEFKFLLYVIDIYSKYIWGIPLKEKKRITITNTFLKKLNKPNPKRNKIWVDKIDQWNHYCRIMI